MHIRSRRSQLPSVVKQQEAGQGDAPYVLFVCVHNAGRSRMAAALFNQIADGRYVGLSAGTEPADRAHPEVVSAMANISTPIEEGPGRLLTQEMTDDALLVVGMGCAVEEACPALRAPLEDWGLDDPKGKGPEEVAEIRDSIEMRVRNLVARLDRESGLD